MQPSAVSRRQSGGNEASHPHMTRHGARASTLGGARGGAALKKTTPTLALFLDSFHDTHHLFQYCPIRRQMALTECAAAAGATVLLLAADADRVGWPCPPWEPALVVVLLVAP